MATGSHITEWITDAGVSGSKPLASRPGGARIAALLDSKNPGVEAVCVASLDRLGRDAAESLSLFKKFRTGKVGLVSIRERVDLLTPMGRAFVAIASIFSQLERELLALRTVENLATIRREGRVFGVVPFGWKAEAGRLLLDQGEQTVLTHIRKLRKQGVSYDRIAKALNEQGTPGQAWRSVVRHERKKLSRCQRKNAGSQGCLTVTGPGNVRASPGLMREARTPHSMTTLALPLLAAVVPCAARQPVGRYDAHAKL